MDLLINAFNTILYQPLFNALILLYQYLPGQDFGMAIIVLTILIKIIFYPLGVQAIKSQKVLSELQPKIKEIQERYKNDREKQTRAIMEFYQKEKINFFSGFLPILIQIPILIALFQVFWKGFGPDQMVYLYSFVSQPAEINPIFLGMVNLGQPSLFLAIFAGIFQFVQTEIQNKFGGRPVPKTKKKEGMVQFSEIMQKQLIYFFPIFTVFILLTLPSAIALYWIAMTIFSIGQQYFVFKSHAQRK